LCAGKPPAQSSTTPFDKSAKVQVTENQSEISQATAAEFAPEAAEDKDNDRTQKDALFLIAFLATVAKAKVIFAIAAHRHPLLFVKYR
jgi:hypothetical protein